MQPSLPQGDLGPRMTPVMVRRAILVSILGSGLEWFDFLIYGYFSRIIAQVFFPTGSGYFSLVLTLATFAIGFLVRPLGGIVLGIYADRYGRSRALSLLIMSMAASTLLMALTPSYAQIGIAAPLLVVLARLLQGMSVGGQFATASAMLVEYAPPGKKMYYGSFNMVAQSFALLLSSGAGYLLTTRLSHAELASWGWRLPFLFGALVGPVGFYIRHRVAETPEFRALRAHRDAEPPRPRTLHPVATFCRENGRAALCAVGVIGVGAATNYVWHSYMAVYVERQLHLPLAVALRGAFFCGVLNLFLFPLSGKLADKFGPYRLFYPIVIVWMVCAYPLFAYVVAAPSPDRLFFAQVVATVFLAAMSGSHPGMLATLFPVSGRSLGVAVSYNAAVTLFGGLAPLTVTWLTRLSGSSLTPAFYLIFCGAVSLALVYFTRVGKPLLGEVTETEHIRDSNTESDNAFNWSPPR